MQISMSFYKLVTLFILGICQFFLHDSDGASAQETLHISGLTPITGTEHDILREAYKSLGIEVVFHGLPGRRSLRASNDGTFDGEAARMLNLEKRYPNLIRIPVPVRIVKQFAYSMTPVDHIKSWDDMKGLKVGFRRGVLITEEKTKGLRVILANGFPDLYRRLERGVVDIAILDEENHSTGKPRDFFRSPAPIEITPLYHYVHNSRAYLVADLTNALRKMKQSGKTPTLADPS